MRKVKLVSLGLSGFMVGGVLVGGLSMSSEALASSGRYVVIQGQKDQKQGSSGVVFEVEYSPFYYKWKESDVKEKGMMHKVELGVNFSSGKFFMRPGISLYGGHVNYDGKAMSGIPIDSDVTYSGHSVELKSGYIFSLSNTSKVPVYVALGIEKWKRALDSTFGEDPNTEQIEQVLGYTEKWRSYYSKIGIAPDKDLGNYYIYSDVYVKIPFGIKNRVEFFDVEVKPKKKLGYGAEVGLGVKHFLKRNVNGKIGFFYEYNKFGKSLVKEGNYLGDTIFVFQPESERKLIGLKMGIKF